MDDRRDAGSLPADTPIRFVPVGVVRNKSRDGVWSRNLRSLNWQERAERMKEQRDAVSEIVIDVNIEEALDGIEGFSHLTVIYWPHLLPEGRQRPVKVHPMGNPDFPLVGVFATHSPGRPNPILITTVRLLDRTGRVLRVTGLDALDGSPVLDIKPYLPERNVEDARVPDWMKTLRHGFGEDKGTASADTSALDGPEH